jgi:hypothetical protein
MRLSEFTFIFDAMTSMTGSEFSDCSKMTGYSRKDRT